MPRPRSNPSNPFVPVSIEWDEPPLAELHVTEEHARSILAHNDSPDVGFRHSVNPYRGCQHACAYCYARGSHQYLGLGAGTDFDTRISVKVNAPELLERELARRSWKGELVAFSGVTDCYQALERRYELTRRCLQVCLRHATPVCVITKSALVARDAPLLAEIARTVGARVYVSIPLEDAELARALEPGAPPPERRFAALAALSAAGVPTGVSVSPIIPGLGEAQVPRVLARAAAAGATSAFMTALRLPAEVREVFEERLAQRLPARASKVLHAVEELRGGRRNDPRFGERMRGQGERWRLLVDVFRMHCRRLGIQTHAGPHAEPLERPSREAVARAPREARAQPARGAAQQLGLFDGEAS